MIISGKEKGKTGRVINVIPDTGRVVVEKLNLVKRHTRASAKVKQGGIIEKESPISISNVMLICEKCKGPVRVGRKVLDDGRRVRFCKKCKEVLEK